MYRFTDVHTGKFFDFAIDTSEDEDADELMFTEVLNRLPNIDFF